MIALWEIRSKLLLQCWKLLQVFEGSYEVASLEVDGLKLATDIYGKYIMKSCNYSKELP